MLIRKWSSFCLTGWVSLLVSLPAAAMQRKSCLDIYEGFRLNYEGELKVARLAVKKPEAWPYMQNTRPRRLPKFDSHRKRIAKKRKARLEAMAALLKEVVYNPETTPYLDRMVDALNTRHRRKNRHRFTVQSLQRLLSETNQNGVLCELAQYRRPYKTLYNAINDGRLQKQNAVYQQVRQEKARNRWKDVKKRIEFAREMSKLKVSSARSDAAEDTNLD